MKISTSFVSLLCALAPAVFAQNAVPAPQQVRRAQVITPSPTPAPTPGVSASIQGCFSGETTVQVLGKGSVAMKDAQIGDEILTAGNKYEPVYAYGHYNPSEVSAFYQLHTNKGGRPLEMTAEHLVFLDGKSNPVRADSVKVGDVLRSETGPAAVQEINEVLRQGLYTLLTEGGTLVADGILASSYISLQKDAVEHVQFKGFSTFLSHHDHAHISLSPFRMFCMGIDSGLCNTYTNGGIPHYVSIAMNGNDWIHQQNIVIEALAFLIFWVLMGVSFILENTFGPAYAPLVVAFAAGTFAFFKKGPLSVRAMKVKTV